MANFNRVFLMGNLTRDPELRYLTSGTAVANLRMAINRKYRTQNGEMKEEVCFVTVVVWAKQAENCSQYLSKGRPVFIEGSLQTRSWETEDGQKRSVMEVRADRVQFLSRPPSAGAEGTVGPAEKMPASEPEREAVQTEDGQGPDNISKEKVPF